ncbi:hypothetical protein HEK616_32290 [Streptomyces nigrescens]|uniref:Uncharacterized protein n=2 Tax=Streptomyces TaxID=1883 RepID=A0ABM7ZTN2_STRNI|nr:hypothetical protein [Streptomyces nigrescens]MEE4417928.1 hypothetical protein [Streptomyces sp. DSM 41528]BDM69742.1 hypothetical protein HEK616_32290 [Streptomyces nigrescens]
MAAMTKDTITAGPASGTAESSAKKMPVPMVAPIPIIVSWKSPTVRRSPPAPCESVVKVCNGLRLSIC